MKNALALGALAALAALASIATGGAMAQSSVTLAGVMDLSARSTNNSNGTLKSLSSGNNSTSRLIFRGSEDLGGGLRAGFWLEGSLQADTGVGGTGTQFWDRQATVSLSGPFGEVRMGRDWTPVYYGFVFADPWINVGVGSGSNFLNASVATTYQRAFGSALNPTTLSRSSNAVEYWLPPNLGGLYGSLMLAPSEGSNATGGFRYTAGRLGYRGGPVDVSVYTGATKIAATNQSLKQTGAFGSYTFGGTTTLMLSITNSDYLTSKHTHLMAGVRANLGPWVLKASYNRLDQKGQNAAGASIDGNDAHQWALGADYLLSKRTVVYATTARLSNSGIAAFAVPGGPGLAAAGSSSSGYEAGIRHSF